ncbi:hypothetical protein D3C72_1664330 [compost metagenome]
MHAQEAVRVALLEIVQRAIEDVAARGGAHREVLVFGLEVEHLGQRHALGAAPVLDQHALGRGLGGRLGGAALLQEAFDLLQRLLQPLGAHGLGEVVDRLQLEGRDRVAGVRRHEHHGRRVGPAAQRARHLDAVDAGHVHVEQHEVEVHRGQVGQRLLALRGLGRHLGGGRGAVAQQRAQARAGQGFVVNDQGLEAHDSAGMAMRTR